MSSLHPSRTSQETVAFTSPVCPRWWQLTIYWRRSRRGVVVVWSLIPCRGDWRRGVLRARMADVPFAWQAWDSGCMSALGKALEGGSAWQVWKRAFSRWCACVSRGRCGERWPPEVSRTWFRVAGVGKRARSVHFAWQAWGMVRPVASLGIVLRGRRRESCAAAETARFRGPVREFGCAGACSGAIGVAKPWQAQGIRGLVDVSLERTFLGTQWRVTCAALCRGTQWQAVGIGVGRVACGAVSWGFLTRPWSGWRRVFGIADQAVVWVACRAWSGRRRVFEIADQGVVWKAPCLWDC